jgi:hypothetical protein
MLFWMEAKPAKREFSTLGEIDSAHTTAGTFTLQLQYKQPFLLSLLGQQTIENKILIAFSDTKKMDFEDIPAADDEVQETQGEETQGEETYSNDLPEPEPVDEETYNNVLPDPEPAEEDALMYGFPH